MSAISNPSTDEPAEFDAFAEKYDETLNQALSVSGEDKNYFAQNRIDWLRKRLARLQVSPARVLDYGCGTGTAVPFLFDTLGASHVIGVDVSTASLDVARRANASRSADFLPCHAHVPAGDVDVAYCNGVFHHIPLPERQEAASCVFRSLRPGGVFGFWENNPWNPGARYCMRVNPFDRDAITLSPPQARRLLRSVGFEVRATNYLFFFPKLLAGLRFLEPGLCRTPLGAQYLLLCQRP